jgi:hypothetical protein
MSDDAVKAGSEDTKPSSEDGQKSAKSQPVNGLSAPGLVQNLAKIPPPPEEFRDPLPLKKGAKLAPELNSRPLALGEKCDVVPANPVSAADGGGDAGMIDRRRNLEQRMEKRRSQYDVMIANQVRVVRWYNTTYIH